MASNLKQKSATAFALAIALSGCVVTNRRSGHCQLIPHNSMAENSIIIPEPDTVYTESQVSFRRDLVLYSRPVKNYDQFGNECFIVHFINGHEMRLIDEAEIAQVKMYLGYPPD